MHIDLEFGSLNEHRTDVCIIGTGVAGITLARRLLAAGHEVVLLESGGIDHEAASAALNAGDVIGEPYYDLERARLRFFGGTTAIWGGRVAELDPIDFERRDWVEHSGWPIDHASLRGYYAEARAGFGLPQRAGEAADLERAGVELPHFDADRLALKLWSFDDCFNRFTFAACRDLREHPRCTILTHATATEICTDAQARTATAVAVRSLGGRRLSVHARAVVLAAGGIENPRLLLASRSVMRTGLGNSHDLVGRFFMEHPHARGGRVDSAQPWQLLNVFGRSHHGAGQRLAAFIAAAAPLQARLRMLNTSLTIAPRQPAQARQFWGMRAYARVKHGVAPTRAGRFLWMRTKRTAQALQHHVDPLRPWLLHRLGRVELALLVRSEQAPNPHSRVTLSDRCDALGMPRVRLDWRLGELDVHSVEQLVGALGAEFERLGLGRVHAAPWLSDASRRWQIDPLVSAHPIGGYHHMGTTRMADSPVRGVTDAFGRVHGIDNLYIAGSSLFPTSGWANPTLTIVALAMRTADRLALQLSPRSAAPLRLVARTA